MPAVKVNGISLAGGTTLSGVARDGSPGWVAVAAAVADMKMFLSIMVGRVIVEWLEGVGRKEGCDCGVQAMEVQRMDL